MNICECGRICKTPQGLGYHKRYCGKNKKREEKSCEMNTK